MPCALALLLTLLCPWGVPQVMRADRELREKQYAERRVADWEDTLRRELELHKSMHQQYQVCCRNSAGTAPAVGQPDR